MKHFIEICKNNWQYKILALLIAFAMWSYVSSQRNPNDEQVINVPVNTLNIPVGFNLDTSLTEVSVLIRGAKNTIESFTSEDIQLWVDLKGIDIEKLEKGATLPIHYNIDKSKKKKIDIYLRPSKLNAKITQLNNRYLPIDLYYDAPPPVGYTYKNRNISHNTVEISGDANTVEKVEKVSGKIPVMDQTGYIGKISLAAYGKNGLEVRNVTLQPKFIDIKVELEEEITRKYALIDPVVLGTPKYPYKVTSIKAIPNEILLEAPSIIMGDINIVKTDIISIDNIQKTISKKVKCNLPPGVKSVTENTIEVIITVEKEN